MTTTQLKYFLAAAKYGSFSRTASAYYTTQPTVSRQIQLLEDELGYELFDRNAKPLKLTAAGHVFNENLSPILQELDTLQRKGELAAKGSYGRLNVTFPTGLQIEDTYAPLFSDIRHSIPGLHVTYQKMDTRVLKEALLSQRTDLVISMHTSAMEDDELDFIDLEQLQSYIAMSPEHPLASRPVLDEEDLYGETMYMINPISGYSYRSEKIVGFHIKRSDMVEVENIGTALLNVRFGGGVTIVNNQMDVLTKTEDFRFFPVLDNSRNPSVSIISRRNNTNPAVEIFRELIRQYKMR